MPTAPGRAARHHAFNKLVAHRYGKKPDGVTLVPWQKGKSLCLDVTVTCPLAESYIDRAAQEAGAAAEMAASRNVEKYVDLGARYIFEPVAVEIFGVFNASARHLVNDLKTMISLNLGEARETSFLYQRISILVQRFNAVLLHDSLPDTGR